MNGASTTDSRHLCPHTNLNEANKPICVKGTVMNSPKNRPQNATLLLLAVARDLPWKKASCANPEKHLSRGIEPAQVFRSNQFERSRREIVFSKASRDHTKDFGNEQTRGAA
jgi:hypothetical protein